MDFIASILNFFTQIVSNGNNNCNIHWSSSLLFSKEDRKVKCRKVGTIKNRPPKVFG